VSDALRFVRYFADLPVPRVDRTKRHRLDDILVVTLCAVVCGADSFEEIERFGKSRLDWLKGFLALPHGIPSHDTFNRGLAAAGVLPHAAASDGGGVGPPGVRRYIQVLRLLERATMAELTRAVERTLAAGASDVEAVRIFLETGRESPAPIFSLDGRPHLASVAVPAPNLEAYALLQRREAASEKPTRSKPSAAAD
jgi:DNA polymerase III epsilon subunit-like protein